MKRPAFSGFMLALALMVGAAGAASAQEKVLYAFGAISMDGDGPFGGLIFDGKGDLYGTTVRGGTHSNGTVFELIPEAGGGWKEKVLYNFGDAVPDGQNPYCGLVFDKRGNLYGTTDNGGPDLSGTVFELSPQPDGTWTEQILYSFKDIDNDGNYPRASLILDDNGNLYGTTSQGGDSSSGTVFEVSPQAGGGWTEQVLHSFGANNMDGTFPEAGLVFDGNGNLYGTTSEGGFPSGPGTVFELTPKTGGGWTEKVLHSFNEDSTDGTTPQAGLIFDKSGNLYGTTQWGGAYGTRYAGGGTVFELTPAAGGAWTEKILYSFGASDTDGQNPFSGLVFDSKGDLYGSTEIGGEYAPDGTADGGTAFKLTPATSGSWTETVLHSFGGTATDGNIVRSATLVRDSAGNLYGTTSSGGSGDGTVFEIGPNLAKAATPVFSVPAGTYFTAQKVKITDATPGAVIYYTTDGDTPTSSSAAYSEPIEVAASQTLQAIAIAPEYADSIVASATYTITPPAPTPTFSPAAGTYDSPQTAKIADTATAGLAIYFTTNGGTPTTSSTKYTSAGIKVTATETIKAIAVATGYSESVVSSSKYTITPPAPAPTFSPAAGTYDSPQTVKIADTATTGLVIYYTTNGGAPTTSSTKYTSAGIKVTATETIKAIAVATGRSESAVASATYNITPPAPTPTFSPAAGTYDSTQTVEIADTAPTGLVIYYTTNGGAPTTSSTKYTSAGIKVTATETIKAIAVATGYSGSVVASSKYTITPPAPAPTFSPAAGTYDSAQTVKIADTATTGLVIYYTTNGGTPTTSSTKYTPAGIKVTATETIKAIAVATGYSKSVVVSSKYIIK